MRAAILIFLIVGCVPMHDIANASVSNPAPHKSSGNSASAGSDRSSDAEHLTPAKENKGQKEATTSDERANRRRVSDESHRHSRASRIKGIPSKPLRNSRERPTTENVGNVHQPSLGTPTAGAAKVANNRTLPVRTTGVAGLNGQQFKSSRDRGAGSATIGGPANAPRSTAAINGTSMNRKHVK